MSTIVLDVNTGKDYPFTNTASTLAICAICARVNHKDYNAVDYVLNYADKVKTIPGVVMLLENFAIDLALIQDRCQCWEEQKVSFFEAIYNRNQWEDTYPNHCRECNGFGCHHCAEKGLCPRCFFPIDRRWDSITEKVIQYCPRCQWYEKMNIPGSVLPEIPGIVHTCATHLGQVFPDVDLILKSLSSV